MSQLNPQQREAIQYLDGPLLVLAGAGSGKTRVITQKIAHLVENCEFNPANIAAITFTNKAAREMQERVSKLLEGKPSRGLTISTFHSLGVRLLRAEARALGYKPQFSILDSTDCQSILADLAKSVDRAMTRNLQTRISNWKNALVDPDGAVHAALDNQELFAARIYRDYEATLKAYQAVDFDDLIMLPVHLFERHPEILEKWQNKLRYLLVDEYQDTNGCQYRLLKLIAGPRAQFTAVGDDDQAIYGWRGADIDNLRRLPEDYPKLKVIKLEQNYRSTVRILKAANALIAHNEKLFEKRLWSDLGHGDAINVSVARDPEHEAELTVMKLLAHKFEHRAAYGDYAILYRSNHQARLFEQQLRNQRVPYVLSGGQSFFEKTEIKDLIAYLRLFANSDDDPAFIRAVTTPRRGVGGQTLEALGAYAGERHISLFEAAFEEGFAHRVSERQRGPLLEFCEFINRMEWRAAREPAGQVLEDLLKAIGYEAYLYDTEETRQAETRWNNVRDFADWIGKKGEGDAENEGKTLVELAQTIALITMLEKRDEGYDAVQLSTLHAAKGLEFKHVFLVGIEEGILPHRESLERETLEEERRLMYVGITRARQSLHVSHAERRKQGGEWQTCEPSRFIHEMGKDDLRFSGAGQNVPADRETGNARLAQLKAMLSGAK